MLLEASWALNIPASGHNILLCGTEGGAELRSSKSTPSAMVSIRHGGTGRGAERGTEAPQDEKIAHFVTCVEQGRPPITTPQEIVNVALILDAVYRSAELGRSVEITPPTV